MKNHIKAEREEGFGVEPAVNAARLLLAPERNSWVHYFVFRFLKRRHTRAFRADRHPMDEAVSHAIAVYEQTVDEGRARLAGRLTEQNLCDLLVVMGGPADASHLQDGWLATAIADSVGAESVDQLPPQLRELVCVIQGLDFLQLIALTDLTRQFWGNGHLLGGDIGERITQLGTKFRD